MMIRELWSEGDEAALGVFQTAVAVDDLAGAFLAIEGASPAQIKDARATLASWARRLDPAIATAPADAQAAALLALLRGELGVCAEVGGNRPEDGALSRVLLERRGRPAVVASVWIEVARRAGVAAAAVKAADKLLVRFGDTAVLADPVAGEVLSAGDLGTEAQPVLAAVPPAELIGLGLRHFVSAYASRNDLISVFRAVSFVCALRPRAPTPCLQRAAIAEQLGALEFADDIYRQVAVSFPGTRESVLAMNKLQQATQRGPLLVQ